MAHGHCLAASPWKDAAQTIPIAPTHMSLELDYNTQRDPLVINEYGRVVHRMVQLCLEEEDRAKRSRMARAVVQTIGKLNPQLRNGENSERTIWDHVHIMAGFKLDVDSPYPMPVPEDLNSKPAPVPYPKTDIRFGHYGKLVERMIEQCAAMEDGPEKAAFSLMIANQMKKQFLVWNRDSVGDGAILKDLAEMGKGKVRLTPEQQLAPTEALLQAQRNGPRNAVDTRKRHNNGGGGGGKKRHRNRKKNRY
jgi:hypothetical protein